MKHEPVARYLRSLGALCYEVSAKPALLPTFLHIIAMVPSTVAGLRLVSPCSAHEPPRDLLLSLRK